MPFKDARSILKTVLSVKAFAWLSRLSFYVKYTKWINISKVITKLLATNVFLFDKKVKTWQQENRRDPCQIRELNPGPLAPQSNAFTSGPPSQVKVWNTVKLFNCFNAIGHNVNKQSRICRPHIFNIHFFLFYFNMHW